MSHSRLSNFLDEWMLGKEEYFYLNKDFATNLVKMLVPNYQDICVSLLIYWTVLFYIEHNLARCLIHTSANWVIGLARNLSHQWNFDQHSKLFSLTERHSQISEKCWPLRSESVLNINVLLIYSVVLRAFRVVCCCQLQVSLCLKYFMRGWWDLSAVDNRRREIGGW